MWHLLLRWPVLGIWFHRIPLHTKCPRSSPNERRQADGDAKQWKKFDEKPSCHFSLSLRRVQCARECYMPLVMSQLLAVLGPMTRMTRRSVGGNLEVPVAEQNSATNVLSTRFIQLRHDAWKSGLEGSLDRHQAQKCVASQSVRKQPKWGECKLKCASMLCASSISMIRCDTQCVHHQSPGSELISESGTVLIARSRLQGSARREAGRCGLDDSGSGAALSHIP